MVAARRVVATGGPRPLRRRTRRARPGRRARGCGSNAAPRSSASHPASARQPGQALRHAAYDPAYRFVLEMQPAEPEEWAPTTGSDGEVPFQPAPAASRSRCSARLDVWWLGSYGNGIFVPLRDATAGTTTYGAGRYLLDTVKGADLGREGDALGARPQLLLQPVVRLRPGLGLPPRARRQPARGRGPGRRGPPRPPHVDRSTRPARGGGFETYPDRGHRILGSRRDRSSELSSLAATLVQISIRRRLIIEAAADWLGGRLRDRSEPPRVPRWSRPVGRSSWPPPTDVRRERGDVGAALGDVVVLRLERALAHAQGLAQHPMPPLRGRTRAPAHGQRLRGLLAGRPAGGAGARRREPPTHRRRRHARPPPGRQRNARPGHASTCRGCRSCARAARRRRSRCRATPAAARRRSRRAGPARASRPGSRRPAPRSRACSTAGHVGTYGSGERARSAASRCGPSKYGASPCRSATVSCALRRAVDSPDPDAGSGSR